MSLPCAIAGKTQIKQVNYYNLRAITAVGYSVNSCCAIEFRKWATEILHEYMSKGFAMDDVRLKQIKHFGIDYFDKEIKKMFKKGDNKYEMTDIDFKEKAKALLTRSYFNYLCFLDKRNT